MSTGPYLFVKEAANMDIRDALGVKLGHRRVSSNVLSAYEAQLTLI